MNDWIAKLKARGLGGALRVALDVLEPLGPLGAQVLWIAQPVSGMFGAREVVRELAETLEAPGGAAQLRHLLDEDD
ncbi:MAG: hypothetical protein K8L99_08990 [Anaerolineae bacterium]|nr:hypothetical protein [Anaerolineae bacterium]